MSEVLGLLSEKREKVLADWRDRILADYPGQAAEQWRREKDPFRNPVGSTIEAGTAAVLEVLLAGGDDEALRAAADGIVRIRAVQELEPSQAVSFPFALKASVRKVLGRDLKGREKEAGRLFKRIDDLSLVAFDIYMECRDKIAEIRVKEAQARAYKLLERAAGISTDRRGSSTKRGGSR